jgi:hypothetical protein
MEKLWLAQNPGPSNATKGILFQPLDVSPLMGKDNPLGIAELTRTPHSRIAASDCDRISFAN